ncbi:MAG TPA: AMP-binding protein, partial [Albitalea sp.]|nr:AMP-binding protein [Albitalea sp.]
MNPYELGLEKNDANFVALSPLSYLERAAQVYPERCAVVYGARRQTWRDTYARCCRLASALAQRGIGEGDTVAVMLPNVPAMFEAHFGVPMSGAVLNTLNTRLDAEAIAFMLQHGEARVLLTDREFAGVVQKALTMLGARRPFVIEVEDDEAPAGAKLGDVAYEACLAHGDPAFAWQLPADEWNAISLNYTSGTTGNPKGVVTHHRGAYL